MSAYYRNCGTPSCIAGWVHHWYGPEIPEKELWWNEGEAHDFARSFFGITEGKACCLFMPQELDSWSGVTPQHAASCLRHLAETGEVDWLLATGQK